MLLNDEDEQDVTCARLRITNECLLFHLQEVVRAESLSLAIGPNDGVSEPRRWIAPERDPPIIFAFKCLLPPQWSSLLQHGS